MTELRKMRCSRNLGFRDCAEILGITCAGLSKLERGFYDPDKVTFGTACALMRLYHLGSQDLYKILEIDYMNYRKSNDTKIDKKQLSLFDQAPQAVSL